MSSPPPHVTAGARRVRQCSPSRRDDAADVPVIAVILMVALTVVIAAGAGIWIFSMAFKEPDMPADPGVVATAGDTDQDGRRDYIRILLVIASDGPYYADERDEVTIVVANGQGSYGVEESAICTSVPEAVTLEPVFVTCGVGQVFAEATEISWEQGQLLFGPCLGKGEHEVIVAIKGQVVYNNGVDCGETFGT